MLNCRPVHMSARLVLAVGASLTLVASSVPGAAAATPSGPPLASRPGYIDRFLAQQATANPAANVRVIITRAGPNSSDDDVRGQGGTVLGKLQLGNATVAELPAGQVAALAARSGVVRVAYDAPVSLQALTDPIMLAPSRLQTVYPQAVDAVNQWTGALPLRGTGVGVAVVDSGVHSSHPDFLGASLLGASRVLQLRNSVTGATASGSDDNGHGTFVAGIIAGRGWGLAGLVAAGSYVGVAPDANLVSIKVSDNTGMAHVSDVISAIEWASQNRATYNLRVLNLSLVSNVDDSYTTDMLDAAIELAWLRGLVVVVAAGNAGPNAKITSPANDPYVITVGATDDLGTRSTADDRLAAFSSYGVTQDGFAKPDLVAPGRHITSTLSSVFDPLALRFPTRLIGGAYINLSGTSAAAPVVTGVVAQLLQAGPDLTPGQVKWLLTHTALPVAGAGTGAGYPQVGAAAHFSGTVPSANAGLRPNSYLAAAYAAKTGRTTWDSVSWDTVSWDTVAWDTVSWDTVSWDTVSWDTVSFLSAD